MARIGMHEGFDVGLEMSGNGSAFNMMIDKLYNGGRVALLGIQSDKTVVDWNKVVLNAFILRASMAGKCLKRGIK